VPENIVLKRFKNVRGMAKPFTAQVISSIRSSFLVKVVFNPINNYQLVAQKLATCSRTEQNRISV